MENCYVLFVRTGKENLIANKLAKMLDTSLYLPFIPMKEKYFRKNGITKKETEICFDGYVFVESSVYPDDFIINMELLLRSSDDMYKIEALGNHGDLLLALSTSGNSENICVAVNVAREQCIGTYAITNQDGGNLTALTDDICKISSMNTQIVQEITMTMFHIICEMLEVDNELSAISGK